MTSKSHLITAPSILSLTTRYASELTWHPTSSSKLTFGCCCCPTLLSEEALRDFKLYKIKQRNWSSKLRWPQLMNWLFHTPDFLQNFYNDTFQVFEYHTRHSQYQNIVMGLFLPMYFKTKLLFQKLKFYTPTDLRAIKV